MAHTLHVKAPDAGYDILFEPGALRRLPAILNAYSLPGRAVIGTNTTVLPLYGRALASLLSDAAVVAIQDGEQYKTLDTLAALYADLTRAGLDRSGLLIALGGGVVGDTVGFAAATYMRGVRLVQIPTTLLSMVDSSVGGKTGVDLPQGKNLVGAFKQPELVIIDTEVLPTLPDIEWRCGLAEVIKHGLLADPTLLDPELLRREKAAEFLPRAVSVKVRIVEQDPFEKDVRAHLNLGHTFAHALEQVSGYSWKHGEAVAVGMVAAVRLSAALALCEPDLPGQLESLLAKVGLPVRFPPYPPERLWEAMATDKKRQRGKTRFVLLKGIGKPLIMEDVAREAVLSVLTELTDR